MRTRLIILVMALISVAVFAVIRWLSDPMITGAVIETDGEQIAFLYWGGGNKDYDLYVQDIGEDDPVQLTRGFRIRQVQWLPDGDRLSFIDQTSERLYTLDVTTGELVTVRDNVLAYDWSRDGSRLAWLEEIESNPPPVLFVGDADGENGQGIVQVGVSMKWSPDGRYLAYVASVPPPDDSSEITIVNVESGESQRLERPGNQSYPDWSPDGRYLLFLDNVYDETFDGLIGHNVMVLDLETDTVIDLGQFVGEYVRPNWSHDSQRLLFQRSDTAVLCEVTLSGESEWCYEQGDSAVFNADGTLFTYRGWNDHGTLCVTSLNVPVHGPGGCFFDWERQVVPVGWRL